MLFTARRLECYGHYFTMDLAEYKGPPEPVGEEKMAGEMDGRLAEEVGKLVRRLAELEGAAALRLEVTVQLEDLASQAGLMLPV